MKKKWQRASILAIAVMASILALPARYRALPAVQPPGREDNRAAYDKLASDYIQAMELVREHYLVQPEYEELTTNAIQGMLRTLDPHSGYYDRKSFEEMRMEQRSQYYGIGASVQQRYKGVYIIEPFRDTPAVRAGLRYGDHIVAIDGKESESLDSTQVQQRLRGELGTEVKISVRRAGVPEPITVKIERGAIDLPSISGAYIVRPGIGYVALSRGFHSTTSEELSSAIASLKAQRMESFILDLRGNPGGFLDQAIRVADKFLQRGQTIVSVRSREGRDTVKDWPAESGAPETFPMVVMIDEGSASASEIVTGAIQDHDRALVVGEPSFGKGLVQTIFTLPEGAGLTLTTARYFTPSGRLIQRDYSSGSSYEYHFRRNAPGMPESSAKPKNDMRQTDLGRPVFGGGGIEPDIKIEEVRTTEQQATLWTSGLFMFVRELMAGRIAAAPQFKRGAPEFDHPPQPNEFVINDAIMRAYREFMADFIVKNPDLGLTSKLVEVNLDWARKKIREEATSAAYGIDTQRRMTADWDVQLQRAIAELPASAQLAERARRMSKSSKK